MSYSKQPKKQYRQSLLGFIPNGQRFKVKRLPQHPTRFSVGQLEYIFNNQFEKPPTTIGRLAGGTVVGYNSHGRWSTLGEIRELEAEERENFFPELSKNKYPDDTLAIWVCLTKRKALRYMLAADQWDHLDSDEPLTEEEKEYLEDVRRVELKATDILVHTDGDDGYLVIRPNKH